MVFFIKNKQHFDTVYSTLNGKLLVIDFTASWCGPCKRIAPTFDKLSKEYEAKAVFCKIDVDECSDLAQEFGIRSMPSFLFVFNQDKTKSANQQPNLVKTVVGADEDSLVSTVKLYAAKIQSSFSSAGYSLSSSSATNSSSSSSSSSSNQISQDDLRKSRLEYYEKKQQQPTTTATTSPVKAAVPSKTTATTTTTTTSKQQSQIDSQSQSQYQQPTKITSNNNDAAISNSVNDANPDADAELAAAIAASLEFSANTTASNATPTKIPFDEEFVTLLTKLQIPMNAETYKAISTLQGMDLDMKSEFRLNLFKAANYDVESTANLIFEQMQ